MPRLAIGIAALLLAATASAPSVAQDANLAPFFIFFDWAKPDPSRDAAAILDAVAAAYRQDSRPLLVAGHSDRSGGAAVNLRSSRQRAAAVRAQLVERGIPGERISVVAYGETRPIVATADGVREAQNRRAEVSFAPWRAPSTEPRPPRRVTPAHQQERAMTRFSLLAATTLAACGLTLGACSREAEAPAEDNMVIEPMTNDMMMGNAMGNGMAAAQSATFAGGDGGQLGSVSMTEGAGGVTLMIEAMGMPAGVHGIHLHEKGMCDGPSFESAGAHWNPTTKQHGRENPQGAHLGDLENITIPATGSGSISVTVAGGTMAAMADADGTALVVHAMADDYKTDPSGNSGDRIACAVVAAPK